MYRQGDVLIIPAQLPEGEAKSVAREGARLVLAHGEVTGHAHAVATPGVKLLELFEQHYLVAEAPFEITHEEHDTVHVPAGVFRVVRQREYSPEAVRQVAD